MPNNSLACKWRPSNFDEVIGQDLSVSILKRQIETGNISNCYLFSGPTGCGKAQPLTSKVLTPSGYINMGDVKVNDIVLDGKGNPTKVLGIYPQGKRDIYRITFNDDSYIEVSDNHINSVWRFKVNEDTGTKDKEYLNITTLELIDMLNNSHDVFQVDTPVIDCWEDTNLIVEPFLLGCLIHEFIPKEYLYSSIETRIKVFKGLMTSHNSHKHDNHCYAYKTKSKQLAEDICFLCRSLGMVVTCNIEDTVYTLSFDGSVVFSERFGGNEDFCEYLRCIKSVELNRQDECQCIFVESTEHTYITDNITVTHNTTVARILANEINQGQGIPREIDGASNNGVDNVRAIIESARERDITSKYKVFIIDEVQQITQAGWNAFLKCIEEPPAYTIFIFCTTDPQKVPPTILNRVMKLNFSRVNTDKIKDRLLYICKNEGLTNYQETCEYISKLSDGGCRDAISMLDKCKSYSSDLSITNCLKCLGACSYKKMFDLVNAIIDDDSKQIINIIEDYNTSGVDLKLFISQLLDFSLDLTKYSIFKTLKSVKIPSIYEDELKYTVGDGNSDNSLFFKLLSNYLLNLKSLIKNNLDIKNSIIISLLNFKSNARDIKNSLGGNL